MRRPFVQPPLFGAEVFFEPPSEVVEPPDAVWRARKAIPGLRGRPRAWRAYGTTKLRKSQFQ
eukprot:6974473-Lingulodinium_polyedra.AAC.1